MELSSKILIESWPELSGNGAKLYAWLIVSAPREGCLEVSFENMARGNGWSLKTLRGAIRELERKSCITAARSTGKHVRTQIRLLHCEDQEPAPSLRGSSAQATPSQSGRSETEAKVTPSQKASSGISTPSQRGSSSVPDVPSELPDSAHVAGPIPPKCLAGELSDVARQTLQYLRFDCDPTSLSRGFVSVLGWMGKRAHLPLPGLLASRILDRCLFQQRKRKAEGKNPDLYLWPAGFQKWRDSLRRAERLAGKAERQARAVA